MSTSPRPERDGGPHPDVYVGCALLAFCGLVYWNTTTFREVPAMLSQNVPPTFFPRLVLTVIGILSVALILRGFSRPAEALERVPGSVVATGAVMLAAVALIPRLGMLTTVALVSIVLPLTWGERRGIRVAALAVLLPLGLYLVFVVALGMRFPEALLP